MPVLNPLPASMLGAVFGRDHAVHVAVAPGKLAGLLATEAGRLFGVGHSGPGDSGPGLGRTIGQGPIMGQEQAGQ
jgi:hypothetical protein